VHTCICSCAHRLEALQEEQQHGGARTALQQRVAELEAELLGAQEAREEALHAAQDAQQQQARLHSAWVWLEMKSPALRTASFALA